MFQRCVAMAFASTGVIVGRGLPSFVTALQASADPAASMVSSKPSTEIPLHFSFSSFLLVQWRTYSVISLDGDDVLRHDF